MLKRAFGLAPFASTLLLVAGALPAWSATADADSGQGPGRTSQPSEGDLEEIIVTAQRRQENLQAVPIAITSISQQQLEAQNVQSFDDLQHLVPSVTLDTYSRDESYLSIRGISGATRKN